ncbi:MAG TPA: citrate lyase subunit alpha [candidate division Zixibacteria bacterium]|nr:citrate lyase subunit alpha [candidate division Zixibacteria bacterium]
MDFVENIVGRKIPKEINGRILHPFMGLGKEPIATQKSASKLRRRLPGEKKLLNTIEEAIKKSGLQDGMRISFHHHFRGGDNLVNLVMKKIAEMGFKNITLAPSSIHPVHAPLVKYIEEGIITNIECGVTGLIGDAVSRGKLQGLLIVRSHGGRARAIEDGDGRINVAFIGAPTADKFGNLNGVDGKQACGPLGYMVPDAQFADCVIAITNNLVPFPCNNISINQNHVDYVVAIKEPIGNPEGIVSGTTRITNDPIRLNIAKACVKVIESSGLLKNGFSFQSGAGGITLAVTKFLGDRMRELGIKGSFGMGGSTSALVEMLEEGLFQRILDVQAFDMVAIQSLKNNPNHIEIGASQYANIHSSGAAVDVLDAVVLGATEVDIKYNVNVVTESDGRILHGIGGHQDTSEGAKLAIVALPLLRGRNPVVIDDVTTVTAPGMNIDVVVTDYGVAVNPKCEYYKKIRKAKQINFKTIEELRDIAYTLVGGPPDKIPFTDRIVALIEHRDGTILDVVRQIRE